tara:strand:- start:45 stop:296 length:252 start_codon:yes stop_codon:yes gene_type:complete
MRLKLVLLIFLIFQLNNLGLANEINCNDLNKLSAEYLKCKTSLLKNKTISAGKSFLDDTKDYQIKEWSDEKKKIEDIKERVLE